MSHHDRHLCCHSHDHGHSHDDLHSHPHTHTHAHPHAHVHSHEHEHVHAHPHDHHGEHSHDHDRVTAACAHHHDAHAAGDLPEADMGDIRGKLEKLLDHWLRHNSDHADNYRLWADRARKAGMQDLAGQIEELAVMNRAINDKIVVLQQQFFPKS
ncbi:MAG: hypothetical protein AB1547_08255 [Thermodesulfobacteriota bacterium]